MKLALRFLLFVALGSCAWASSAESVAVLQADARRIQAIMKRDAVGLRDLLSEDLHYAHADGRVQTKAELLAALSTLDLNHLSVDPKDVKVQLLNEGAAIVTGLTRIVVESNGQRVAFSLRFLAVWRDESDHWRLVAYQSSQLSAPGGAVTK